MTSPSRRGLALLGFTLVAGYFLLTENRAHLLQALPWVLVLACPLLHFFRHGPGHSQRRTD